MSKMNSFQNKVINFLIITFCSVVGLTTILICSNVNIYKVSAESAYILGSNVFASKDSRRIGIILNDKIIEKVISK